MRNGKGYFPPSLFKSDFSYSFNPNVFSTRNSYEEEVKYLLKLAQKLQYKVYIRDVSFLGFPSVYIYIPKVSILGRKDVYLKNEPSTDVISFEDLESIIFPFDEFINDKLKIKKAIVLIEKLNLTTDKFEIKDLFHLSFKQNSIWDKISITFFMSILHFLVKNYDKSILSLKLFLKENDLQYDDYYTQILNYMELLKSNQPTDVVAPEIIKDFKDANSIFKYIGYPICPNCQKCLLKSDCLTLINVKKAVKINERFSKSVINQNKFSIFS